MDKETNKQRNKERTTKTLCGIEIFLLKYLKLSKLTEFKRENNLSSPTKSDTNIKNIN